MCGIAGYSGKGSTSSLESMSNAMKHRGPDDQGYLEKPGYGFAFRRMSVIDLETGHQPMSITSEEFTFSIVFNGEIYNFQKIKKELIELGHEFNSKSDTEVILRGYCQYGTKIFSRLEGMFAIAIWDGKLKRIVLARDHLGKKPLHYALINGTLWFASELDSITELGLLELDLNLHSVAQYFVTDSSPTENSVINHVKKLGPATYATWDPESQNLEIKTFWKPIERSTTQNNVKAILADFEYLLNEAVTKRLVADVPIGLFLSSGIDSSAVAISVSQNIANLSAYNLGFNEKSFDESYGAAKISRELGLNLKHISFDSLPPEQIFDLAVDAISEPLNDPAVMPQLMLSKFAKEEVDVVITGDGGDELFLGYQQFLLHKLIRNSRIAIDTLSFVANLAKNFSTSSGEYFDFGFKLQRFTKGSFEVNPFKRDLAWRGAFTVVESSALLNEKITADQLDMELNTNREKILSEIKSNSVWKSFSWLYFRTYLLDTVLVKVDRTSMAFGLEARSPLLDKNVVEFCLSLDDKFRIGDYRNKFLLKEMVKKYLPSDCIAKQKHGFGVPVANWLRGPLRERLEFVSSNDFLSHQGIFSADQVRALIEQHLSHKVDRRKELWGFLVFQYWYLKWMNE